MKFTLPRTTLMMATALCMASPIFSDAEARSNDRQGSRSSDYQSFRDNRDRGSERGGRHDQFDFQRTRNRESDRDAWSGYERDQYTQGEKSKNRQGSNQNRRRGFTDDSGFRGDQSGFRSQRSQGRDTWRDRQRSSQDGRNRYSGDYGYQQDQRRYDRGDRQFSSDRRDRRFSSDRSRQGQSARFRNQRERGYDGTRDPNRHRKTIVPRGYDYRTSPPGLYEEDYDSP